MKFNLRNILLKDYREKALSIVITKQIESLENLKKKRSVKILDYGSGYNPILIRKIINTLSLKYKKTKFVAYCYDYYDKNEVLLKNKDKKIKFFHINNLRNSNKKFSYCLIIDVLHHIGINEGDKIKVITKKLKKLTKYIIIKDHFQYGLFSNLLLIIMDFIGNYFDGVKIPSIYFNKQTYKKFLKDVSLKEIKRITNIKYYKWYWFYINNKKLQFISILK
jgi:hypothetical protein